MDNIPVHTLSLEQQYALQVFRNQVQRMSREQAQEFCVKLYEHNLALKTTYSQLLKQDVIE